MKITSVLLAPAALLVAACSLPVETFRAAAYSEIARVQMAAGDPAGARDTAQRAVAAIAGTDDEDERAFGLPAAAIAQVRAGDLDGAQDTVESADKDKNRIFAYAALAVALEKSGHPAQARRAASRALEAVTSAESEYDRDGMMVYAAWAQAVTGGPAGALRHAEGMIRRKNRDGLLALIAEVQLEAGDIAGALATVESSSEAIERPDNDAWIFSRIVRGIAVDPIAVFDDLLFETGMTLQAIIMTRVAIAQARAGDSGGARRSFLSALRHVETANSSSLPRVQSIGTIALGQARSGDISGAIESLDRAGRQVEQATAEAAGDDGEARINLDIIRSAIGGRTIVDELMQRPDGADDRGEAFVPGAMAHIKLGNASGAAEYLAAAAERHLGDDGLSLIAAAYSSLSGLRTAQGDRAGGRAAAGQSLAIADRTSARSEDRVIGLFFASVALARAGDIDRALDAAGRMEEVASK
jgi:tetratricopeptide (TPR) repeat protein